MTKIIQQKLIKFVREEIGEYKMNITESTLIEDELGVTGDEVVDLIKNYSSYFNVDISDFIYSKYFHPEPSIFMPQGNIHPLTISDLEEGIKSGKLV